MRILLATLILAAWSVPIPAYALPPKLQVCLRHLLGPWQAGDPAGRCEYSLDILSPSPHAAGLSVIGNFIEVEYWSRKTASTQTIRGPVIGVLRSGGIALYDPDLRDTREVDYQRRDKIVSGHLKLSAVPWKGPFDFNTHADNENLMSPKTKKYSDEGWFLSGRYFDNRADSGLVTRHLVGRLCAPEKPGDSRLCVLLPNGTYQRLAEDEFLHDAWVAPYNPPLRQELEAFWGLSPGELFTLDSAGW